MLHQGGRDTPGPADIEPPAAPQSGCAACARGATRRHHTRVVGPANLRPPEMRSGGYDEGVTLGVRQEAVDEKYWWIGEQWTETRI
eukprot:5413825-Prymnesium_polylepis.1